MKKVISLILFFFLIHFTINAQECWTDQLHEYNLQNNIEYQMHWQAVEDFIQQNQNTLPASSTNAQYTIPIVFQVTHHGEPIGEGANISDEKLYRALDLLNADFANVNGEGVDIDFEFCLASVDPDGNLTTGINRNDGSGIPDFTEHGFLAGPGSNEAAIKDLSRWSEKDYINVYIVPEITHPDISICGLATLPTGFNYDGIVIDEGCLLKRGLFAHEIGHSFGLRHTFYGEYNNNCNGNEPCCPINDNCQQDGDRICDTPPHIRLECGEVICGATTDIEKVTKNIMSYCSDRKLFTQGQKDWMHMILQSPSRNTLLSSAGCNAPNENVSLLRVDGEICDDSFTPKIKIRNRGASPMTSVIVEYQIIGQPLFSETISLNLNSNENKIIELSPISTSDGNFDLGVELLSPNGTSDSVLDDNVMIENFDFQLMVVSPNYEEDFENEPNDLPDGWRSRADVEDLKVSSFWKVGNVPGEDVHIGTSIFLPTTGLRKDELIMPILDFSNQDNVTLTFDMYFINQSDPDINISSTTFKIYAQDCISGTKEIVYEESGYNLFPISGTNIEVDLSVYDGKIIQLSFEFSSTIGFTILRLDNINIQAEGTSPTDCPTSLTGFTEIGEFENSKYFLSNDVTQWQTADANAQNAGGHLVAINSQGENDFLQQNISEIVFIGFNDAQTEGTFAWSNGDAVTFDNFSDTNSEEDDFGKMNFWNGGWGLDGQWVARKYIVEIPCSTVNPGINISNCPNDISVVAPHGGNYSIVVDWDLPTATTDCAQGGLTMTQLAGQTPGSLHGVTTQSGFSVVYQFSDACGNTELCVFSVTVMPEATIFDCPQDITIEATSPDGIIVDYPNPQIESFCNFSISDITVTSGLPSGSLFPIGTTEVSLNLYFSGQAAWCNSFQNCSFNVTVLLEGGGGNCPDDILGFTALGEFGNSKYYLSNDVSQPEAAQVIAEQNGGYLVAINDQAENDFLQQNISEMVYIGLNDVQTEGELVWENGDPFNYDNINPCSFCNENSDELDYVIIAPWDGSWSFSSKWNSRKYIVEIPCNSSGQVEVTYDCPTEFPQEGTWNIPVTISNNSGTSTIPQTLSLFLKNNSYAPNPPINFGFMPIPVLADGEEINVNLEVTLPNILGYSPNTDLFPNINGSEIFYEDYYLSLSPSTEIETTLFDFYCKKYLTDLDIEIQNIKPTYGPGDFVEYSVAVTNNGSVPAYNIQSKILETLGYFSNPAVPYGAHITNLSHGVWERLINNDMVWFIPYLGVGDTATVDVTYYIDAPYEYGNYLPDTYTVDVNVTSGHLQDSNLSNNFDSYTFIKDGGNPCPTDISGFSYLGNLFGNDYFLSNDVAQPADAQNIATQLGGNLASINSQEENDFLQQNISEMVYIGLNDANTEGTLEWMDGEPVTFENFDICSFCNENSDDMDYVVMHPWNGGWSWSSQWNSRKYIVKIPCNIVNNNLVTSPSILISTLENKNVNIMLEKLHPNPTMDDIFATIVSPTEKEVGVQIFDARGSLMKTQNLQLMNGKDTYRISIADLPGGFYSIYVPQAQRKHSMLRFVKVRD